MAHRKALGKGLGALIPDLGVTPEALPEGMIMIGIDEIRPNPRQPRRNFDPEKIRELAASIREHGIIQPLIVKKCADGFELVAGERRWRAAQKAELAKVPVIVKTIENNRQLEQSLIENIQREDLNVIEEAEAFQKLLEEFGYTQEVLAQRLGKSRTSITNTLRLLKLNRKIKDDLMQNRITMGHARAYLGLDSSSQQLEVHNQVIKKQLSVRQTERLVNRLKQRTKSTSLVAPHSEQEFIVHQLRKILGTKVSIRRTGNRGKIIIEFYSPAELERIFELLSA
jgi:ParB family chromosome partitioning protein